jgi:GMP synthase (glutamine-hydrolysing)
MTARDIHLDRILILDFGAQYTQLIARRVREIGVYCEIYPYDADPAAIRAFHPHGIILSGGPESTTVSEGPRAPRAIFDLNVPLLGICYGMQTMAVQLGGAVESSDHREFGYARVRAHAHSTLLRDIEDHASPEGYGLLDVWMSHGDRVTVLPPGFARIASTETKAVDLAGGARDRAAVDRAGLGASDESVCCALLRSVDFGVGCSRNR